MNEDLQTICVISGASGSGKSTLINKLFSKYPNKFAFSISHTTRDKREGETDGKDYHFVSIDRFQTLLKENKLVEHTFFSGNYYGTSIQSLHDCIESGRICVLDVDIQGVQQLIKAPIKCIFIFIQAPTMHELRERLENRKTDTVEAIERRLASAKEAIDFAQSDQKPYDYTVFNDNVEKAYAELEHILLKHYQNTLTGAAK